MDGFGMIFKKWSPCVSLVGTVVQINFFQISDFAYQLTLIGQTVIQQDESVLGLVAYVWFQS